MWEKVEKKILQKIINRRKLNHHINITWFGISYKTFKISIQYFQ